MACQRLGRVGRRVCRFRQALVGLTYSTLHTSTPEGQRFVEPRDCPECELSKRGIRKLGSMHICGTRFAKSPRFAKGRGRQGGRSWCQCDQRTDAGPGCGQHEQPPMTDDRLTSGTWMVESLLVELDQPGEYYFDTSVP